MRLLLVGAYCRVGAYYRRFLVSTKLLAYKNAHTLAVDTYYLGSLILEIYGNSLYENISVYAWKNKDPILHLVLKKTLAIYFIGPPLAIKMLFL